MKKLFKYQTPSFGKKQKTADNSFKKVKKKCALKRKIINTKQPKWKPKHYGLEIKRKRYNQKEQIIRKQTCFAAKKVKTESEIKVQ